MRRLQTEHVTEYRFGVEVTLLQHTRRLQPRENHNLLELELIAPRH